MFGNGMFPKLLRWFNIKFLIPNLNQVLNILAIHLSTQKQSAQDGFHVGEAVKARSFANLPANILTTFVSNQNIIKGDKRYKVTVLNETELKEKDVSFTLWGRDINIIVSCRYYL